jgi:hypothetical protein
MKKMSEHGDGIALVFARTDTRWFQDYVLSCATSILFIKGRLKFYCEDGSEAKGNAGAPSVLIAYGNKNALLLDDLKFLGPNVWLEY